MKEPGERTIIFQDLLSKKPKVRYGCGKRLLAMAKDSPDELYPHIDRLIELLNSDNQILEWTAIDIVGYLSRVDAKKKIDRLIERLFGLLGAGKLITANHAIGALAHIAKAKPHFQKGKNWGQTSNYKLVRVYSLSISRLPDPLYSKSLPIGTLMIIEECDGKGDSSLDPGETC